MFQRQTNNFFGFGAYSFEPTNFEKTATFFNPNKKEEAETSFSTQGTDITRANSSQSTPPQVSKGDDVEPSRYSTTMRVPHLNIEQYNRKDSFDSPLSMFEQSPPIYQQSEDKSSSTLRNCLSQDRSRLPNDLYGENFDLNTVGESKPITPTTNNRLQSRHESLPQIPDQIEKELENFEIDAAENTKTNPGSNNMFRIRTEPKNKSRIAKFNKIRVISVIPSADNIPLKSLPAIKRFVSGQRLEEITKDELPKIQEVRPKPIIIDYALTTETKNQLSFDFPEKLGSNLKKLTLVSPTHQSGMCRPKKSTFIKDRPSATETTEKSSVLEILSDKHDFRSLLSPVESGVMSAKNYVPERTRVLNACKETDAGMVLGGGDKGTGQKRIILKFKNEQVLLNKLFDPTKQRKKI